ncbi:MAG: hypothetical protein HOE90_03595, partial [Bacteriovoracaceae bacterium]|nr:hypothetical protein [Bacteriovoracaceae bacterium]
ETMYSDACSTGSGTVVVADTSSTQTFYYKDTLAGGHNINVSVAGFTTQNADSAAYTIDPAAANKLIITTEPSGTGTAGSAVAQQPVVEIRDTYDNVRTADTDTITMTGYTASNCTSASGGTSTGNTKAAASGVATFTALAHQLVETVYFKATTGGLTADCTTGVVISAAAPNKLVFKTAPSNENQTSTNFGTQPIVEVQDQYSNIALTATDSITLAAHDAGGCGSVAGGTLSASSNPLAANGTNGTATFAGVQYDTAETIYLKATSGGLTMACSGALVIYAPLTIDDKEVSVNTLTVTMYEISGGIGPYTPSITTNNSGGSVGGMYTGGACPGGKSCFDWTAGATGNAVSDTMEIADSATATNTDTDAVTVNGADFDIDGTSDPEAYGTTGIDVTNTFVVVNNGNTTSGAITVTFTPDDAAYWTAGADTCDTTDLGATSTCSIDITFLGATGNASSPVSGPYTATITVVGASGGTQTFNLTATIP